MAEDKKATANIEQADQKEESDQDFKDAETSQETEVTKSLTSAKQDGTETTVEKSLEDIQGQDKGDVPEDTKDLQKATRTSSPTQEKRASKTSISSDESPNIVNGGSNRVSKSSTAESISSSAPVEGAVSPKRGSFSSSTDHVDATPKPAPSKTSRFGAFSASLPTIPWGSSEPAKKPTGTHRDPSPQPPAQSSLPRRNTPFGWLSRATSNSTSNMKSPPLPPRTTLDARRNTAASISTLGSNSELMLKALEETQDGKQGDKGPARQSLREKFKLLRMQDEASVIVADGEKLENGAEKSQDGDAASITDQDRSQPQSPGPLSPTINPELPPGTVSGFLSATAATPIDWDFWQTVVNEGPQAVARTSPEELTAAIAGGIPQTIRGVIWQVLASSKNEDLEAVYHELRTRGTKEHVKDDTSASISSTNINGSVKEKDSIASSKSSIHSDNSTPATSSHMGVTSPVPSTDTSDPIGHSKTLSISTTEPAKRTKADAAAIAKLEKMIKRDMGSRTSYSKYTSAAGFQDGLFNVCKAYALFDDAVGYPQGMNFVIMPMLFVMSEEEAFCLLVRLMHKYHVREMFVQDMPGLHLHLYQFERLLEDLEPTLYCHLNRRGVTPKLYATQWFLTLFAYRLPLQLVMRVFDLVLCEGLEGAILKFGMALIQRNVQTLMSMEDMQALTTFLKEKLFDIYIDQAPTPKSILESGFFGNSGGTDTDIYRADILVQDACSVKLTPEMLLKYTAEYEEKTRTEKARETELENLKSDTSTKAAQIRSLEQRAEKSDAEHIELANELVKLKVENQDLLDQNESLKGQVEELKKVAESEASNVEKKLKASTEAVMQKNIEVQNQNRHMEEQMAEMERELVEMKMKFAELNGDHEGLKQRWSDLKRALE